MSNKPGVTAEGRLVLKRRNFLCGTALGCAGLPLPATAGGTGPLQTALATPRRAVMHQMAWFDRDGVGEVYDPPHGNQSTREYVNGLSQEAFLRRHWFT